ncbi:hypothetical protein [Undibacterium sp. Ji49W]|uniref:hypothetical protein n=1 Tax=Undibacterium sp. Ji49W TaxID=3413040 RepID=UPI003BF4113E
MTISVTLDANVWNYLFNSKICLVDELPPEFFSLYQTREVEIEIEEIPNFGKDSSDKQALKEYIGRSIQASNVITSAIFGFAEASATGGPVIYAGFGQGTFESEQERAWREREETKRFMNAKSRRPTGLAKNEADVSVAVASLSSVVITADKKAGPISDAAKNGGRVLYLDDVIASGLSLSEFITKNV